MNIILASILFFVILYLDVHSDYKKWKENKPVKHLKEWLFRALFLVPSAILLALPEFSILSVIHSIGIIGFTWLLLFDGFYNKIRGFNWWFLGSKDKDDAWWDKLQRKIPLKVLKITKISIPLLLILIYIL